jgi:hypothetical protein
MGIFFVRLFDNLNTFGWTAFGSFPANIFEIGRNFVHDYLGDIAVHLENLGAKVDTNLIASAKVLVY